MLNINIQKNYKTMWFFFIATAITGGATCAKEIPETAYPENMQNEQLLDATTFSGLYDEKKQLSVVVSLVKNGANVNYQRPLDGFTALMGASALGNINIVDYLLEEGASTKPKNDDGFSALALAINAPSKKQLGIIKLLVEKGGANINELVPMGPGLKNIKILEFAVSKKAHKAVIDYLKSKGATK